MNRFGVIGKLFVLVVICLFLDGCKDSEPGSAIDFDRAAMLEHIGEQIIIPSYQTYQQKTDALHKAAQNFINNIDQPNLDILRTAWYEAYLSWQDCSPYEFGPAAQLLLRANTNTFPVDTVQVKENLMNGENELSAVNQIDAKGFPALDYILYGIFTDEDLLNAFQNSTYQEYLLAITSELKESAQSTHQAWVTSGDNYLKAFVSNTGVDVGSSLGMLVNQLNFDYELVKNAKIGIPLGKRSLGTPLPYKVEAYYYGNSLPFALANIKAHERLYYGQTTGGGDGPGLDDYLIALNAVHNETTLSAAFKTQWDATIQHLEQLQDPLSGQIKDNPDPVELAYTEIQKLLILLKTDLPSAMGILITYQDNDGD